MLKSYRLYGSLQCSKTFLKEERKTMRIGQSSTYSSRGIGVCVLVFALILVDAMKEKNNSDVCKTSFAVAVFDFEPVTRMVAVHQPVNSIKQRKSPETSCLVIPTLSIDLAWIAHATSELIELLGRVHHEEEELPLLTRFCIESNPRKGTGTNKGTHPRLSPAPHTVTLKELPKLTDARDNFREDQGTVTSYVVSPPDSVRTLLGGGDSGRVKVTGNALSGLYVLCGFFTKYNEERDIRNETRAILSKIPTNNDRHSLHFLTFSPLPTVVDTMVVYRLQRNEEGDEVSNVVITTVEHTGHHENRGYFSSSPYPLSQDDFTLTAVRLPPRDRANVLVPLMNRDPHRLCGGNQSSMVTKYNGQRVTDGVLQELFNKLTDERLTGSRQRREKGKTHSSLRDVLQTKAASGVGSSSYLTRWYLHISVPGYYALCLTPPRPKFEDGRLSHSPRMLLGVVPIAGPRYVVSSSPLHTSSTSTVGSKELRRRRLSTTFASTKASQPFELSFAVTEGTTGDDLAEGTFFAPLDSYSAEMNVAGAAQLSCERTAELLWRSRRNLTTTEGGGKIDYVFPQTWFGRDEDMIGNFVRVGYADERRPFAGEASTPLAVIAKPMSYRVASLTEETESSRRKDGSKKYQKKREDFSPRVHPTIKSFFNTERVVTMKSAIHIPGQYILCFDPSLIPSPSESTEGSSARAAPRMQGEGRGRNWRKRAARSERRVAEEEELWTTLLPRMGNKKRTGELINDTASTSASAILGVSFSPMHMRNNEQQQLDQSLIRTIQVVDVLGPTITFLNADRATRLYRHRAKDAKATTEVSEKRERGMKRREESSDNKHQPQLLLRFNVSLSMPHHLSAAVRWLVQWSFPDPEKRIVWEEKCHLRPNFKRQKEGSPRGSEILITVPAPPPSVVVKLWQSTTSASRATEILTGRLSLEYVQPHRQQLGGGTPATVSYGKRSSSHTFPSVEMFRWPLLQEEPTSSTELLRLSVAELLGESVHVGLMPSETPDRDQADAHRGEAIAVNCLDCDGWAKEVPATATYSIHDRLELLFDKDGEGATTMPTTSFPQLSLGEIPPLAIGMFLFLALGIVRVVNLRHRIFCGRKFARSCIVPPRATRPKPLSPILEKRRTLLMKAESIDHDTIQPGPPSLLNLRACIVKLKASLGRHSVDDGDHHVGTLKYPGVCMDFCLSAAGFSSIKHCKGNEREPSTLDEYIAGTQECLLDVFLPAHIRRKTETRRTRQFHMKHMMFPTAAVHCGPGRIRVAFGLPTTMTNSDGADGANPPMMMKRLDRDIFCKMTKTLQFALDPLFSPSMIVSLFSTYLDIILHLLPASPPPSENGQLVCYEEGINVNRIWVLHQEVAEEAGGQKGAGSSASLQYVPKILVGVPGSVCSCNRRVLQCDDWKKKKRRCCRRLLLVLLSTLMNGTDWMKKYFSTSEMKGTRRSKPPEHGHDSGDPLSYFMDLWELEDESSLSESGEQREEEQERERCFLPDPSTSVNVYVSHVCVKSVLLHLSRRIRNTTVDTLSPTCGGNIKKRHRRRSAAGGDELEVTTNQRRMESERGNCSAGKPHHEGSKVVSHSIGTAREGKDTDDENEGNEEKEEAEDDHYTKVHYLIENLLLSSLSAKSSDHPISLSNCSDGDSEKDASHDHRLSTTEAFFRTPPHRFAVPS